MASTSFRDSINSLGWSRRDEPVNTSRQSGLLSSIQSLNPFSDRGYVRLPTSESAGAPLPQPSRREEEEGWFVLSRWDRLIAFAACNLAALACFVICFTLFPVLSMRPRKFVILWTVGSLMFLASFAAVMGPMNYFYHLLSTPRLPFTAMYFGSITLTLVFALKVRFVTVRREEKDANRFPQLHSTILTLFSAIVQLACLAWYLISYFPMGSTGLRLAGQFGARQATAWMSG
ncbi:Got1/Sft2-like family-domain-containing protein [Mariannaea sp. PMI_226]|nr:Got1/Sft2-like family-domain-containing protein [Mariannaea sp. PMI_226]